MIIPVKGLILAVFTVFIKAAFWKDPHEHFLNMIIQSNSPVLNRGP